MSRLVADENIAITSSLRACFSDIMTLPGRDINRDALQNCDALLVRSVTPVTRELLEGTVVRFVGTATAGIDHVDTEALSALGIGFSAAPGSNANAVAEYVMTAAAATNVLERLRCGAGIGIVGYGAVGRRVAEQMTALGAAVAVWDPYSPPPSSWRASCLEEALTQPVVTLHASLHDRQPWPSRPLITADLAHSMAACNVMINAGRGGLVTDCALFALAEQNVALVLDTWPCEPEITAGLLDCAAIATPHIAGYSAVAKCHATNRLVEAMWEQGMVSRPELPAQSTAPAHRRTVNIADHDWRERLLLAHYPIFRDDAALRALASPNISGIDFDKLRSAYPLRDEWVDTLLCFNTAPDDADQRFLLALGVRWTVADDV